MLNFLNTYGYLLLFAWVFVEQLGLPIPAIPALLAAGALIGDGQLKLGYVLLWTMVAALIADMIWFEIGRRKGLPILSFLCRISLERDSCVRQTKSLFARHGANSLLIAKFIPGLSTVAPPLAGIVEMRTVKFLIYDGLGNFLWISLPLLAGFFFRHQLSVFETLYHQGGHYLLGVTVVAIGGFISWKYWKRRQYLKLLSLERISADDVKRKLDEGLEFVILDIRHGLDLAGDPQTLPGALHIPLDELRLRHEEIPLDQEIVTYCDCPQEASAAMAATRLIGLGRKIVKPLAGGLSGWRNQGFPTQAVDLRGDLRLAIRRKF